MIKRYSTTRDSTRPPHARGVLGGETDGDGVMCLLFGGEKQMEMEFS